MHLAHIIQWLIKYQSKKMYSIHLKLFLTLLMVTANE